MADEEIRFYLDENLPVEIARQLASRGIEAVTARDLGLLGAADLTHLVRARELGYVFCTMMPILLTWPYRGWSTAASFLVSKMFITSVDGLRTWNLCTLFIRRKRCRTAWSIFRRKSKEGGLCSHSLATALPLPFPQRLHRFRARQQLGQRAPLHDPTVFQ